jgi:hypothetical protein
MFQILNVAALIIRSHREKITQKTDKVVIFKYLLFIIVFLVLSKSHSYQLNSTDSPFS